MKSGTLLSGASRTDRRIGTVGSIAPEAKEIGLADQTVGNWLKETLDRP